MASLAGTFIAYKTVQLLTRKWKDWDAYKLGIIDKNGDTIRSPKTAAEKASFDMFQIMVRNLKQLLEKFPFGKSRVASFAAGLFLIKEQTDGSDDFERIMFEYLEITPAAILLEESEKVATLPKGIYDYRDHTFIVTEAQQPYAYYLGHNIYKLRDVVNKEFSYVTVENLQKYK